MATSGGSSVEKETRDDMICQSNSDNVHTSVAAFSIKPPPFYKNCPESWFRRMESQFVISGITSKQTKFHHVMASLPEEVAKLIPLHIVEDYDAIKSAVMENLRASKYQLIEEALSKLELGD